MSAWIVSFMFTVGACTWIYTKLQRTSGNNTKQSAIATGAIGVMLFIVAYLLANLVL